MFVKLNILRFCFDIFIQLFSVSVCTVAITSHVDEYKNQQLSVIKMKIHFLVSRVSKLLK